jgi:alkylation response protein AidB-like acyl-CoA dehydrogenase
MDFELTDDQQALRDAARDLLDDLASPAAVRAHVASGAPYDVKLWRAVLDQGWMGIAVPEDAGGLGLGPVELAVVLEEVGRHAAPVPYAESVLALHGLNLAGRPIDALLAGDAIGSVAWGGFPASAAPFADVCVVADENGDITGVVEFDAGNRPPAQPAMDVTRALGWVDAASAAPVAVGFNVLDWGALLSSALLLGGAQSALDMAVAYAKNRVQFGKPIGSFQAVKHRCADMLVDVEGMRSTVYYAAWALAAGDRDASIAASTAKIWCADAGPRVMASSLQVHGGIGFTWEHDLHFFLKRAQLDAVMFGDASFHRQRLAALLRPRVEAGESVV